MNELVEKWSPMLKGLNFPSDKMEFVSTFAEHLVNKFTAEVIIRKDITMNHAAINLYILSKLNLDGKTCDININTQTRSIKIKYDIRDVAQINNGLGIDMVAELESIMIRELSEKINRELEGKSMLLVDSFVSKIITYPPEGNMVTVEIIGRYEIK